MLGSLSSAVSGLDAFQEDMNVIGNNIANINTDGFKAANVDLADSFSNTLQAATGATSSSSGTDAMQVGTGVGISAINNNWAQGTVSSTGDSNDLAINGPGFFIVNSASGANASASTQYVTQDGSFTVDSNGNLVNSSGYYVQGISGSGLTNINVGIANATSYSVSPQGVVSVDQNGSSVTVGQIALQNFQNPSALQSVGDNLYSNMSNAGPLAASGTPGASGLGTVQSGSLELSNVDLSSEMANLITAQRGFEANSKIITASDEMLQTAVNMVH